MGAIPMVPKFRPIGLAIQFHKRESNGTHNFIWNILMY